MAIWDYMCGQFLLSTLFVHRHRADWSLALFVFKCFMNWTHFPRMVLINLVAVVTHLLKHNSNVSKQIIVCIAVTTVTLATILTIILKTRTRTLFMRDNATI